MMRTKRGGSLMRMAGMALVGLGFAAAALGAAAKAPGVGDVAPAFSLPGSDGKSHSLADFKGKQAVVLAWFPKAFTGG
jgi:peroxiredoxin Q/BCP